MNASCKIDYNSVSKGIKNSVKKTLIASKLFTIDDDVVTSLLDSDNQGIIDNINTSFGENIVSHYKGNVFVINDPSATLAQKYIDHFSNQFVPKAIVPPKPKFEKGQFQGMPEFNKLPYKSDKPTMTYAGIGSRETPPDILQVMKSLAEELENLGYTVNTGDAGGADKAFRDNAKKKNVFNPKQATTRTLAIAQEIHPAWDRLNDGGKKLQARNTYQIFGNKLDTPVDFVIAWTQDGLEDYNMRTIKSGGTGQAIDMASRKDIPVINLANPDWRERLDEILNKVAPSLNLSNKTVVDNNMSWGELKNLPVFSRLGINVTRKQDTHEHFGNPFIGSVRQGRKDVIDNIIVFGTVKKAAKAYKDWIEGKKHQKINPEQREWIIGQLESGNLKGKTLLYYKPGKVQQLDGTFITDYESHADVLADIINNYESNIPKTGGRTELWKGFWTREQVAEQQDKVFLFGDNTDDRLNTHHIPSATQAVIRGLPNAIGIDTKKDRGREASSYFSDEDFDQFKQQVDEAIQKAKDSGKNIVIPGDGIGTGKAMLKEKAPKLFEYLQKQLNKLGEEEKLDTLYSQYKGTLSMEAFNGLSEEEQQTIIDQQNNC